MRAFGVAYDRIITIQRNGVSIKKTELALESVGRGLLDRLTNYD